MKEKVVKATHPEIFAQALVAALRADKGVPAFYVRVAGDLPGTWAVLTETLTVIIEPKEPAVL